MDQHGLIDWRVELHDYNGYLGTCNRRVKLIRISRHHIYEHDAAEVRDTILHEIAHALTPRGEPSHGKVWSGIAWNLGVRDKLSGHRWGLTKRVQEPKTSPVRPKATPEEIAATKLAQAREQVKRFKTKIKRSQIALTKWERKVKLYEGKQGKRG
jgi:hypothetical protein